MAKLRSVIGSGFSGRIGNVVGRKNAAGTGYVISSYQPSVANPKSLAQSSQRVKFALASKVAGAIPTKYLRGYGNNGLMNRAGFLRSLLRVATSYQSSIEGEPWAAIIEPSQVVPSRGQDFMTNWTAEVTRPELGVAVITPKRSDAEVSPYSGLEGVAIIGLPARVEEGVYISSELYSFPFTMRDTPTDIAVPVPAAYQQAEAHMWVYLTEKRVNESALSGNTGGAGVSGANDFANGTPVPTEGSEIFGNSVLAHSGVLPVVG